jgi:hypothetical protein
MASQKMNSYIVFKISREDLTEMIKSRNEDLTDKQINKIITSIKNTDYVSWLEKEVKYYLEDISDGEEEEEEEEDLCEKCEDINCCTKDELICCMCCELLKCDMFSQNCGKCVKPMCMNCDNDERKFNGENVCEKCEEE